MADNKLPREELEEDDPRYKPFDPFEDTAEQEARKKALESIRNKFRNK